MNKLFECRRTFIAFFAIIALTFLACFVKAEVSGAIATIVMAIAGANSAQGIMTNKITQVINSPSPPSPKEKLPVPDDPG